MEGHAPNSCIWTKQIKHSLRWIKAFLHDEGGNTLQRGQLLTEGSASHHHVGRISLYGMGATLQVNGKFLEFFAIGVSDDDCETLGIEVGSSASQQIH